MDTIKVIIMLSLSWSYHSDSGRVYERYLLRDFNNNYTQTDIYTRKDTIALTPFWICKTPEDTMSYPLEWRMDWNAHSLDSVYSILKNSYAGDSLRAELKKYPSSKTGYYYTIPSDFMLKDDENERIF